MIRHYVNLSNGIEALPELVEVRADVRFMRLRSTDCEHKHWADIITNLPDDFLLDLAAGRRVIVHDRACSNRAHGLSRAQWQGLAWVRYALTRADWGPCMLRDECGPILAQPEPWRPVWDALPGDVKGRLRWFSRWVQVNEVRIECQGGIAEHDGDSEWHRKTWAEWLKGDPLWT